VDFLVFGLVNKGFVLKGGLSFLEEFCHGGRVFYGLSYGELGIGCEFGGFLVFWGIEGLGLVFLTFGGALG